jgi:UDP-2-acetamido-2,6-beta-L-arabino-hexul-4-ose reductase
MKRILLTGAAGFIGQNLSIHLREHKRFEILPLLRSASEAELTAAAGGADAVVHLAAENRPADPALYEAVNVGFTRKLCAALRATGRPIPVLFASSTQATLDNQYGASKRAAETELARYSELTGAAIVNYRLPNVFGKWCRPNYNSVVATFCHNVARGLSISINDPSVPLTLVYVDDVAQDMVNRLSFDQIKSAHAQISPQYTCTVGQLAETIEIFKSSRENLRTLPVGTGLMRALYATYLSYLPPDEFSYPIKAHSDERGQFVEVLKTVDSGQFSFFTAFPGVTRGGHYHHSKVEKFLVVQGKALFKFRHIITNQQYSLETEASTPRIVETIPGWSHDITNTGNDLLVAMLWANELFDPQKPDTIAHVV